MKDSIGMVQRKAVGKINLYEPMGKPINIYIYIYIYIYMKED